MFTKQQARTNHCHYLEGGSFFILSQYHIARRVWCSGTENSTKHLRQRLLPYIHPPACRTQKQSPRKRRWFCSPPPVHAQQVERYELHPLRICTYFLFLNCYILSLLCTAAGALAWVSQRGLLFTFLLRVFPACWLIRVFHSVRTLTLSLSLPLSLSLNHFYVRHRIRIIW